MNKNKQSGRGGLRRNLCSSGAVGSLRIAPRAERERKEPEYVTETRASCSFQLFCTRYASRCAVRSQVHRFIAVTTHCCPAKYYEQRFYWSENRNNANNSGNTSVESLHAKRVHQIVEINDTFKYSGWKYRLIKCFDFSTFSHLVGKIISKGRSV